jgi:RNA polymerase sigma factor (sigma-70 family)
VGPAHELRRDSPFERLYRQHRRDVYGAVLRDVRDPDEAEDVTQIAFLNAYRAMRKGEQPEKPRAWLVTIARNVIRRRYRELARRPREVVLDPDVAESLLNVDGPTAGEITAAMRRLPASQRAVILLREIQGHSYSEIAGELGLSLAAVETLIFRARRSLSEELRLADQVPTTQHRRARGWFVLPLPGLGKLSLGFSAGRLGAAAVLGSVAMIAVPISDIGGDESRPAVQRGPSLAEAAGPAVASPTALAPVLHAASKPAHRRAEAKLGTAKTKSGDAQASSEEGGETIVPSLPVPSVDVPSTDGVALPPLTVDPLPLPVDPLPLPDDPLPDDPTSLPPPLPLPELPLPLPGE